MVSTGGGLHFAPIEPISGLVGLNHVALWVTESTGSFNILFQQQLHVQAVLRSLSVNMLSVYLSRTDLILSRDGLELDHYCHLSTTHLPTN